MHLHVLPPFLLIIYSLDDRVNRLITIDHDPSSYMKLKQCGNSIPTTKHNVCCTFMGLSQIDLRHANCMEDIHTYIYYSQTAAFLAHQIDHVATIAQI